MTPGILLNLRDISAICNLNDNLLITQVNFDKNEYQV